MSKWTADKIRAMKGCRRITAVTAFDYSIARIIDAAGIELVLVGDSLAMTVLGYDTTLPVTMSEMLHHTSAVARGTTEALVVADMPFMSYQVSVAQAMENAGRFVKEAGADAVKIEGGAIRAKTAQCLIENGIPVLGHIGLTPQSVRTLGGYKVQGKKPDDALRLIEDAKSLEKAGIFALVLECVPRELGTEITKSVGIPTIGIGAGPDCDGQILVSHDLLGMQCDTCPHPKFVKRYANLGDAAAKAFETFKKEVESGDFPTETHTY